jgi:hypothetical protein
MTARQIVTWTLTAVALYGLLLLSCALFWTVTTALLGSPLP